MAGSEYDASVNVSLEFEAGMGKRCHYIRIRDNNECGDVLIRNFSSQLFEVSSDEPLEISPASAVVEIADPECSELNSQCILTIYFSSFFTRSFSKGILKLRECFVFNFLVF